jgi:hypothetical protein
MKAFQYLQMMVLAVSFWSSLPAFGYQLTHDYYNRFRSPYRYNLYLSQQVNAAQGDLKTNSADGGQKFSGNGLQLAAGMEHFRFIQTGAFFATTQMQNPDKSANEMRMVDSGVDAKMVMSTPLSNIVVGGAAVYSRANLNLEGEKVGLNGAGYRGSFEISYYASAQVSLVLSATHTVTNYTGKNSKGESLSPIARTSRVGAGLTVWL